MDAQDAFYDIQQLTGGLCTQNKTILFASHFCLENGAYYTLYCSTAPFQVSQDLSTLDCDPVQKLTLNLK